jgi:hypothetical protein
LGAFPFSLDPAALTAGFAFLPNVRKMRMMPMSVIFLAVDVVESLAFSLKENSFLE